MTSSRLVARWLPTALLLAIAALSLLRRLPEPTGDAAPADAFATTRALAHLDVLASESRFVGTPGHAAAHGFLIDRLTDLGLELMPQDATVEIRHQPVPVHNVAARLPGTDSTGAVLVVTHYDSVEAGPGAGDDGAAVACLLEVLRALKAGPPLPDDVIALFTDGEELGLLGAQVFVREHPWRQDPAVVLNFDARGSRGPLLMFQTSPAAGALVRLYADTAPDPTASSLMADVYERMPNDTDFTVFLRAGHRGLNFAFLGGYETYHTALDTVARVDRRTLTQTGQTMLSLCRRLGALDLHRPPPARDLVYFDALDGRVVSYSQTWATSLAIATLLVLAAAVVLAARAGRIRLRRLPRALGLHLLAIVAATVVTGGLALAALAAFGRSPAVIPTTGHDAAIAAGLACVAVIVALVVLSRGKRLTTDEITIGAMLWWGVALAAVTVWVPGATFLLTWPLLPCALVLAGGHALAARHPSWPSVGVWVAAMVPAAVLVAPTVALLFDAMTLKLAAAGIPLLVLTVGLAWPVLPVRSLR